MHTVGTWRKLVVITIVTGLLYAQVGYLLRYELQRTNIQRGIKDKIRQGIPLEELAPFQMAIEQWEGLNWVKPAREFRLPNGEMYDVVHVVVKDGQVDALCVHDKHETVLVAGLKDHMRRIMDGPDPASGGRAQVARMITQMDMPPGSMSMAVPLSNDRGFLRTSTAVLDGFPTRCTPPPKSRVRSSLLLFSRSFM